MQPTRQHKRNRAADEIIIFVFGDIGRQMIMLLIGARAIPTIINRPQRRGDRIKKTNKRIFCADIPTDVGKPESVFDGRMRISDFISMTMMKTMISSPLNGRPGRKSERDK